MFPVGMAISTYRRQSNLTAAQAASKLGISRGFLSILETGLRLPSLSLDFVAKTADLLHVPVHTVLSSVSCEHFLSSVKNFKWFPLLLCRAVSMCFRDYYLKETNEMFEQRDDKFSIYVLRPSDSFRTALLHQIIRERFVPLCCEEFLSASDMGIDDPVDIYGNKLFLLGMLKNVKADLIKSDGLFSFRETILFMDSFSVDTYFSYQVQGANIDEDYKASVFSFSFHLPLIIQSDAKVHSYKRVSVGISPFDQNNPIHFWEFPMPSVSKPSGL